MITILYPTTIRSLAGILHPHPRTEATQRTPEEQAFQMSDLPQPDAVSAFLPDRYRPALPLPLCRKMLLHTFPQRDLLTDCSRQVTNLPTGCHCPGKRRQYLLPGTAEKIIDCHNNCIFSAVRPFFACGIFNSTVSAIDPIILFQYISNTDILHRVSNHISFISLS